MFGEGGEMKRERVGTMSDLWSEGRRNFELLVIQPDLEEDLTKSRLISYSYIE